MAMLNRHHKQQHLYALYKNKCVEYGKLGILSEDLVSDVQLQLFESDDFGLVWMCPEPRIGVFVKQNPNNPSLTLRMLYNFLSKTVEQVEQRLSAINKQYQNFGSHLCLFVNGQEYTWNLTYQIYHCLTEMVQLSPISIVGYIQMDEQQYFRWLPYEFKPVWLTHFEHFEHIVLT